MRGGKRLGRAGCTGYRGGRLCVRRGRRGPRSCSQRGDVYVSVILCAPRGAGGLIIVWYMCGVMINYVCGDIWHFFKIVSFKNKNIV